MKKTLLISAALLLASSSSFARVNKLTINNAAKSSTINVIFDGTLQAGPIEPGTSLTLDKTQRTSLKTFNGDILVVNPAGNSALCGTFQTKGTINIDVSYTDNSFSCTYSGTSNGKKTYKHVSWSHQINP